MCKILVSEIQNPVLSFVIPTYKRADLLSQTLDSVLAIKDNLEYEIIVGDNNSERDDETENIMLTKYNNPKITYFKNKENIGGINNWNKLFQLARGKWVTMIHDDDLLTENFIEEIKPFLNSNFDIIGFPFNPFKDFNQIIRDTSILPVSYNIISKKHLWIGSPINIAGITIKKETFNKSSGFNPSLTNADGTLITEIANKNNLLRINRPCAWYRISENDSMKEDVMIKAIIEENSRTIKILKHNLPNLVAKLIQIRVTSNLENSWKKLFNIDSDFSFYDKSNPVKNFISKFLFISYSKFMRLPNKDKDYILKRYSSK